MTDYTELVRKMRTCIGDKKCFEKECRYWSELGCMDGNICCDAAAAIEELQAEVEKWRTRYENADDYVAELNDKVTELKAEVKRLEPKRGEWIWDPDGMDWGIGSWKCKNCHARPNTYWQSDSTINPLRFAGSRYCPNCGAKMDGKEKDDE